MRNLTIKRTKTFVGCLAKLKVYIEDASSNELLIKNTPCRKIGDLKNGEEKTFQIGEQKAKVFIIADKISKNYCNEYYQLPEGKEDISLSGKNKFNIFNGNAFQFDNNNSEEILANRKRSSRKGLLVLVLAIVVGAVAGYLISSALLLNQPPVEKIFSSNGLTISLTNEFKKADVEGYTIAYDSKNVAVFALKEEFTLADGLKDYTPEQYAAVAIQANQLSSAQAKTVDGLTYFEYDHTNSETNQTYHYFSYVYKSTDAFWLIQFATLDENANEYAPQIAQWAKSVMFSI